MADREVEKVAKVRFEVRFPEASAVYIAGTFNDWDGTARRLKRVKKGEPLFVAVLDLPPGHHEFKYVVDGEWVCCPNSESIPNEMGGHNSVVEVAEE